MWRRLLIGFSLILALSVPALAQQPNAGKKPANTPPPAKTTQPAAARPETTPPPQIDEGGHVENPPEKLQLAYIFEKGQVSKYQVQIMNRGSFRLLGQKKEVPLKTITEMFFRQTVRSEEGDGLFKVEWAMLSGIVRIPDFGESAISVPELSYVMDERGNVKKIYGLEKLALLPGKPQQKTFATILGQVRFQGFPKEALKVGDEWTREYAIDVPDSDKIAIKVKSKLLGYEKCDSYDCAKIETKYDYPVKLVIDDKTRGKLRLEGKESGSIITFFAFKEGKMIRTEGDIVSDAKVAKSDGTLGDAFIKLELNAVSRLLPNKPDEIAGGK